ncbi:hypothetical protein Y032_0022g629 [Ancylostoma ceylanicum]|uniref:Uncharacterized protein n=1 Tax=Ancylostoma ceylanicum TaxID=53326 RepID=A0A016UYF5_9BILA|nr:hypothetical protein Y032_0022g629 [Ancylostoma ceylanicum]
MDTEHFQRSKIAIHNANSIWNMINTPVVFSRYNCDKQIWKAFSYGENLESQKRNAFGSPYMKGLLVLPSLRSLR